MDFPFERVISPEAEEAFLHDHKDLNHVAISRAAFCAKTCRADCIVVPRGSPALPFLQDISASMRCLLTDASFLLTLTETFVRGFEIPWTYRFMMWDVTWETFYLTAEPNIFEPLTKLVVTIQNRGCSAYAVKAARSIAFNRMPQVCYTRDRLQWLSMQRDAARRDGFTNQNYVFEISDSLNFYYLLLSGTFDHLAVLVNAVYGLGLSERQVGATYKSFLDALRRKSARMHSVFASSEITDFALDLEHSGTSLRIELNHPPQDGKKARPRIHHGRDR